MKNTRLFSLLSALILALFLTACGNESQPEKQEPEKEKQSSYTVKDDFDKEITFDKTPKTVVSLQPSNTEILYALGLGDNVIGVTSFDNYPEEAKKVEHVSDSMTVNAEKVIALKPDVVIAYTTGEDPGLELIEQADIPVFTIKSASTFEDVYGDIEQIATVMGVEDKGKELVNGIKKDITAVQEKVAEVKEKEKVYFEISPSPDIFTTGAKTFQQEILTAAGVENLFADQEGWIKLSEEEIIKRNPNIIMTTVNTVDDPIKEIKSRNGWNQLNAVKNNKIFMLDPDIMSRPGPRIGEAVELAAKTVYPDIFK